MRILNNNELQTLENICGLSQKGLKRSMSTLLRSKYNRVIETSEYLCAEGDIPIALVAHMDTVFPTPAKNIFYDRRKNVLWSPTGLGADDRAGIYAITQILKTNLRPHIILTTDEEIGAAGALALSKIACPFQDLRYMIELDRRGTNDCVFYDCDNSDFIKYIENFGFIEAIGTFSDISLLMEAWGVAGVNLSIGYQDEHTTSETLWVQPMLATIDKICQMLHNNIVDIPYFKFIPMQYSAMHPYYWFFNNNSSTSTHSQCQCCKNVFTIEDMVPVKMRDNTVKYFCIDCIVDKIEWCEQCGEAYEHDKKNSIKVCNDCRYELYNVGY